jgi:Kef-type K+ transport system membrane component KefB
MVATAEQATLRAIVNVSLLTFMAKMLAGVFSHLQLPEVLGEVLAWTVLSMHLLGGIRIAGNPIIELNVHVVAFAEIGAILVLFVAGLEVEFAQFRPLGGPRLRLALLEWLFRGVRNGGHRDRRITEWIEEKRISSSSASRK